MKNFFGFAVADSMFAGDVTISRREISAEEAKAKVNAGITPALNPSHKATIQAAKNKFGLEVTVPDAPPKVALEPGDSIIVMGVRGLPRLTDRHEYTQEEIDSASFSFAEYTVQKP